MATVFYDREGELGDFLHRFNSMKTGDGSGGSGELIVLYGRRRVGKTELVKQFLQQVNGKRLYFYVDLVEKQGLLDSLSNEMTVQLGDVVRLGEWGDFFDYIGRQAAGEPFILVMDEFQRFLEISPDFITKLQRFWDEKGKDLRLMIILVGSSMGMMYRITKSATAPLYGRISTRMKIGPFRFVDFRKMFKSLNEEEKVVHYAVFGGTPYYLTHVKNMEGSIHDKILNLVLKRGGKLSEEPSILMESENIRTHARYNSILQAIAMGKEVTKEIQDYSRIPSTTLPAYLKRLDALLDLVYRKEPVLGKEKHGRYRMKDNFFSFWYRFVFHNQSALNLGNVSLVEEEIRENLSAYVGKVFENIMYELLTLYLNREIKGHKIDFQEIGSWWDRKGNEIDIVAYNKKKRTILVGEIKWTNQKVDVDLVNSLIEKSKRIPFNGTYSFMLVSKRGFTEQCIERMKALNFISLDLSEIEKLFDEA